MILLKRHQCYRLAGESLGSDSLRVLLQHLLWCLPNRACACVCICVYIYTYPTVGSFQALTIPFAYAFVSKRGKRKPAETDRRGCVAVWPPQSSEMDGWKVALWRRGVFLSTVSVVCRMESLTVQLTAHFTRPPPSRAPSLSISRCWPFTPRFGKPHFRFALFYFELGGDPKGCFAVPLANVSTCLIRSLGKFNSLMPTGNPLTNEAIVCNPTSLCLWWLRLERSGCFLRFLQPTGCQSFQESPNITHN